MQSTASATGQKKRRVTIEGEHFDIGCLTMRSVGKLQNYIENQEMPPYVAKARVMAENLDAENAKNLLMVAQISEYNWPPQILNAPEEAFKIINRSEEGWNLFLFTVLQDARPDLHASVIQSIIEKTDTDQFETVWMAAMGLARPDVIVNEARSRLCVFSEDGVYDFARGVVASLGVDVEPQKLDAVMSSMSLDAYGSVLNMTLVKGVPSLPKVESGHRRESKRSTSQNSTGT